MHVASGVFYLKCPERKRQVKKALLILGGMVFMGIAQVFALDTEAVELNRIVVTPYRYSESLGKTNSSVSVITSGQIKDSNARNVTEALRAVPGITIRDWYGNGSTAAVDIGGFGEQGALNVLVMVDGRRVNNVDLSGVDWTQIPLEQIQQIEIVRSGSAGVLYGDNAVSGAINIITKKGSGKPKIELAAQFASYDTNSQSLSLSGGVNDKLSYFLNAKNDYSGGYRDNSYTKNSYYSSRFGYDFTDTMSLSFASGFHSFNYGMPASLNQANIDRYGRRHTRYSNDHTNGKDYYFVIGPKAGLGDFGNIEFDLNYRKRDTDSYFLNSKLDNQQNRLSTIGVTPKYTLDNAVFCRDNKFIAGLDFYRSISTSNTMFYSGITDPLEGQLNQYSNVNKNSLGGYLQDEFSLFKPLVLIGGYRYELARYTFGYHDNDLHGWGKSPDQDKKIKLNMEAFNTGSVYTYKEGSNLFFNVSKSFRFPEVDEFSYLDQNMQKQLDTNLKPQSSINYQAGLRHKLTEKIRAEVSATRMNVKDEIYMNAKDFMSWGFWTGKNANYDKTIHDTIESSLDIKLTERISAFGNYNFTRAYFHGGMYDKNEIPLVPRHKASVGVKFALPAHFTFNMTGTYVGRRYFLNDQSNSYSRLNGYTLADTNLSWQHKDLTVTFGVNNLFDKEYSEYAGVNVDSGDKFYYPSPERSFSLKMDYKF